MKQPMRRKIIQISSVEHPVGNVVVLYALTDDGNVYCMYGNSETWNKLPAIPQDGIESFDLNIEE